MKNQKILIAGGSIGGLTAALCLHKAGFAVQIFEAVQEIKPLGVGINLLPHSVRVLTNLGLEKNLGKNAVETTELVYFNKFGQKFWHEPRGRFAGYKWPQFSLHRGELQLLLLDVVKKRIGEEAVFTGHQLQSFEDKETEVTAHFHKSDTGEMISITGDVLIGADGINSVVRKQLYPTEGPPKYSGNVLYRGTTMMDPFLTGSSMAMIGHLKQKMVVYPIRRALNKEGFQLINWVANLREGDDVQFTVRDWNRRADKERLLQKYASWKFDWLNVPRLIAGAEAIYEFPMSDRDPLERWSFGRVTLLGDAAHPMYPIGSNGASQAILDADALVEAFIREKDPVLALQQYDEERRPATAKVVMQNRQKGPDQIMDMMEERAPNGFMHPDEAIPHEELKAVMDHYRKVAGFDVETLNRKA